MSEKKKIQKSKTLALALGEGSHTHQLTCEKEIEFEMLTEDVAGTIDMLLKGTGVITHEEHARIVLPKGKYRKYPQIEFDPLSRQNRAVFD